MLRGGSWNNNPDNCRSANRNDDDPDDRNNNYGFRAASTHDRRSRAARVSGPPERAVESPGPGPERRQNAVPNARDIVSHPLPGRPRAVPAGPFSRSRPAAVEACRDLLLWLVPTAGKLPRSFRFTLGDRIERRCYDVLEQLVRATYAARSGKTEPLRRANVELEVMRHEVRIALDLRLLTPRQHEHAARLVDHVGRQVGAWLKSLP